MRYRIASFASMILWVAAAIMFPILFGAVLIQLGIPDAQLKWLVGGAMFAGFGASAFGLIRTNRWLARRWIERLAAERGQTLADHVLRGGVARDGQPQDRND